MRRVSLTGGDGFQVRAGAEVSACAGEDGDGDGLVGIERLEGIIEGEGCVVINGVAGMGPVDGDDADGALGGVEDCRRWRVFTRLHQDAPPSVCFAATSPASQGRRTPLLFSG